MNKDYEAINQVIYEESFDVVKAAIGTEAKAVCGELRHLGKRCSVGWIYRQMQKAAEALRLNFYGAFLLYLTAITITNGAGAMILLNHLENYIFRLKRWIAGYLLKPARQVKALLPTGDVDAEIEIILLKAQRSINKACEMMSHR